MRFEKRQNGEWAVVPNGQSSRVRMDGHRGLVVHTEDGAVLDVWEERGKIHVGEHGHSQLGSPKKDA